jgi:hypothetical protein
LLNIAVHGERFESFAISEVVEKVLFVKSLIVDHDGGAAGVALGSHMRSTLVWQNTGDDWVTPEYDRWSAPDSQLSAASGQSQVQGTCSTVFTSLCSYTHLVLHVTHLSALHSRMLVKMGEVSLDCCIDRKANMKEYLGVLLLEGLQKLFPPFRAGCRAWPCHSDHYRRLP